jgi:hypothetical protein
MMDYLKLAYYVISIGAEIFLSWKFGYKFWLFYLISINKAELL